ncbi:hypothetical protein IWQ47_003176 [Aquimarina sp. EL_43]|uniref:hypothetical protein n=1 Tax=Aquimarina TaxID=290174 RepID=UPI00046E9057|nr:MULTISPECIES: hypothetical protein [Aquimarina]MBG6131505.1 hypothetical protein [Aquimarina sp. EL_35]MBG6151965.1 hypothetical protein [Aquimarina sp. EL_32]MBG6170091.1 hypothetical protein [Aquimarina sp. EL_43]
MKRIIVDVEKDKLPFILELLEQFDFVSVLADASDEDQGMYDSIVSLQKGVGIPRGESFD